MLHHPATAVAFNAYDFSLGVFIGLAIALAIVVANEWWWKRSEDTEL